MFKNQEKVDGYFFLLFMAYRLPFTTISFNIDLEFGL